MLYRTNGTNQSERAVIFTAKMYILRCFKVNCLFQVTCCLVPFTGKLTYLHYPHFHFAGRFRADTATLNNFPNFFDMENFTQSNTRPSFDNWNPLGSGEWMVEGRVTHVCYSNYSCAGNPEEEPACGAGITGICDKLNVKPC